VWTKVEIPLVAEKDETWVFPISGRVQKRKRGEVLQPDRFSPDIVAEKQRSRLVFAGQYQQHPAPLEGNLIKRSDVQYWGGMDEHGKSDESRPEKFDMVVVSADCAFKDLKTSDYVAVGTVGVKGRKRFILKVTNAHLDVDATELEIRRQIADARQSGLYVSAVLVEDKANGPAVVSRLKQNVPGVIEINPQGGKTARMFAVSPEWQAGDWYVERNASWAEPFVQQITLFPMAANDDMADMMTQAAIWIGAYGRGSIYKDVWTEELLYSDAPWVMSDGRPGLVAPHGLKDPGKIADRTVVVVFGKDFKVFGDFIDDGAQLWLDREYWYDARQQGKTDRQLRLDLKEFMKKAPGAKILLPKGFASFEAELLGEWYVNADEDELFSGIRMAANMMGQKKIRFKRPPDGVATQDGPFHDHAGETVRQIQAYMWDQKAAERGIEVPSLQNSEGPDLLRWKVLSDVPAWRLAA
jgi:predicted phage terminase large subunit-like protein